MIIVGYQGIGKSTLAGKGKHIDLESGNFWVDGKRADDWYIPYCQIAVHLSKQGFVVFMSSHKVVRDYLKDHNEGETIALCYPALALKDQWINKLQHRYDNRYDKSNREKDYKALMNAKEMYDQNIIELFGETGFIHIIITDYTYNLSNLIYTAIPTKDE